ncbi:PSD1 and planctomycete cytochrome C domain-containing protein [Verrucomicrobiota bacterium sgz303538]
MRHCSVPKRTAVIASMLGLCLAVTAHARDEVDFLRDVRPILSAYCFKCHGPDEKARKAELRLDVREEALKEAESGAKAIVPGKPNESELVARILSDDRDEVMPPPQTKHELTASQKETLKKWVATGAEYRPHWAFVPPNEVPPPEVKRADWPKNPIDRFVLARLEQEGLSPSAEADKYALCRRVYLDVIGLPPTPEEADAFVNGASPDAWERLVDKLLASPHYGERWARRWLDLARYADTNGYEKDRTRNIWPYRDWVIRALNADMPFNEFTIKQLAGDMLPGATQDDLIATGFHRNTMLNEEGGIDPLEFRFNAMVDRVSTTGTTWLGLTVGCAQCHTHKYDPILHKDYYQLMAFLNNADEPELDLDSPDREASCQRNREQAAKLLTQLSDKWPLDSTMRWETPKPVTFSSEKGETPKLMDDNSVLFSGVNPETDTYTFVIETDATSLDQLRLEALTDPALPAKGPGRVQHGNFVLSELLVTAEPKNNSGKSSTVKIVSAHADVEQSGFPVSSAFDGQETTGWAVHDNKSKATLNTPKTAMFRFEKPIGFSGGTRFTIKLVQAYGKQHTIGRVRLSLGAPVEVDSRSLTERRKAAVDQAFATWLKRERERTVAWTPLRPVETKTTMPLLTVQPDNSIFASGDITKDDRYDLKFKNLPAGVTAIRLEALPDDRLPGHGPGMTYYEGPKGDFFVSEFQVFEGEQPVKIAKASESHANGKSTASLAIDGDAQTGWSCSDRLGEPNQAVFVLAEPLAQAGDLTVKMQFSRHYACPLGHYRISVTTDPRGAEAHDVPQEIEQLLSLGDEQLNTEQRQQLREHFLLTAPELATEAKRIRDLRKPPASQTTLVMRERPPENPRPTFLHNRGEFLQPKERMLPNVPSFLPPLPPGAPKNRLALAHWLVSPENPLTARVTVNRQWQAFFGSGLVRTLGDFGFQGEMPSHPELLDWLAIEFVKQGWSMKKLHRLILTSATYRQSARVTTELLARDPQNKLLARGPRVRLEAELVRDGALLASGLLSEKMYGAPVRPPQPAGVTEVAYGAPKWDASTGEDRFRRALYTFAKRSAPFAMFNTFDAPTGEVCIAKRDVSNTPLQSLTLLNDEMLIECAQALGSRASEQQGSDELKAAWIFRRCLTRPPKAEELEKLVGFVRAQRGRLARGELKASELTPTGQGDANERAAWTTLARAILNLDETITKS